MHYVTTGEGAPLLLLHGTPKTHYYWYNLIPLLTPHFKIVAPDLRGFGDTDKPPAEEGYDSLPSAKDVAKLMTQLGHQKIHLHGEDRGAEFAYALEQRWPPSNSRFKFSILKKTCWHYSRAESLCREKNEAIISIAFGCSRGRSPLISMHQRP